MSHGTKPLASIPALLALALGAGPAWCQPLTEEDLRDALDTQPMRASLQGCTSGTALEGAIVLEIVVVKNGSMTLAATDPPVEEDVLACLGQVVSSAKVPREMGASYQVGYPIVVAPEPDVPQPATAPAPQPGKTATQAAVVTAGQPGGEGGDWETEYMKGRRMLGAGIALTALGGGLALGTGVYAVLSVLFCAVTVGGAGCGIVHQIPTIVSLAVSGLALMGTGIGLLVGGIVTKRRAGRLKRGLQLSRFEISPLPDGVGAITSLVLTF